MGARPDAALTALDTYTQTLDGVPANEYTGEQGDEALFVAVTDLLADLMHLLDEDAVCDALSSASMHFNAERNGE